VHIAHSLSPILTELELEFFRPLFAYQHIQFTISFPNFLGTPIENKKKKLKTITREVPERQVWTACPYATEDRGEEEL
jgi:hypothetical protein